MKIQKIKIFEPPPHTYPSKIHNFARTVSVGIFFFPVPALRSDLMWPVAWNGAFRLCGSRPIIPAYTFSRPQTHFTI